MKLKTSEKRLLILLGGVIILYLLTTYLIFPIMDKHSEIQAQYDTYSEQYSELKKNELSNSQLKEVLANVSKKYNDLETLLPPQIHQEESIVYLLDLAKKYTMEVDNYTFSYSDSADVTKTDSKEEVIETVPVSDVLDAFNKLLGGDQTVDVQQYKDKIYKAPEKDEQVLVRYEKDLKYFNVEISLKGEYTNFKNYVADLEKYKHKIIIKKINISKDEDKLKDIMGTISISLPIYYDQEKLKLFEWQYEKGPKSTNPFEYIFIKNSGSSNTSDSNSTGTDPVITNNNNNSGTGSIINNVEKPYTTSDFYLTMNPANSDSNTMTIGKTPYRYTALYADNTSVESATLKLRKMDGKFQYQYSTSLQTYPGDNEWNDFDLAQKGQIVLEVQSSLRLPNSDNSGVLLSVSNETGIPLNVYIYGEDQSRPRLTVNKVKGKVNTIKK